MLQTVDDISEFDDLAIQAERLHDDEEKLKILEVLNSGTIEELKTYKGT